jgi:LPXTG-motif cell wall-anchored protein
MRNALTVLATLVAIVATASTAVAQTQTVTVTRFSCDSVTVEGAGWEQTEATVEIAIPPSEGGEGLEDFVAGPVQVFPDTQGNIPATTLEFTNPPPDGDYVAVVLVDSIVRAQSAGFALTGCTEKTLPRTGSATMPMLATGLVLVAVGFGLMRRTRTN